MRVSININFDVEPADVCNEHFNENVARAAAEEAALNHLSFVEISGYSSDSESVLVYVDGFGECEVRLAED